MQNHKVKLRTGIYIKFYISPGYMHLFSYGSCIFQTSPAENYLGHCKSKQNQVTGVLFLLSNEDNVNALSLPQWFKYSSSCRKLNQLSCPCKEFGALEHCSPSHCSTCDEIAFLGCWQYPD